MASNDSVLWKTDQECIELLSFLIEKTKDVEKPFNISQLAREFKEKSKSSLSEIGLWHRIVSFCSILHEMEQIDVDTKVRLLFALSVPIDSFSLQELKTRAEVVLDNNNRIIKYRKYGGGGLELGGNHVELEGIHTVIYNKSNSIRRDKRMLEFLARKAMKRDIPINNIDFVREFKKAFGTFEHNTYLRNRFKLLKNKIHESTDFDQETKIRMMFISNASVPDCFLEILRKDALVEVDKTNRITKYTANDGSLELEGEHSRSEKTGAPKIERSGNSGTAKNRATQKESSRSVLQESFDYFENQAETHKEMNNLIQFITEKCENIDSPLNCFQCAEEFNNSRRNSKSLDTSYQGIKVYRREIQSMKYLDTPTKVKQLFGLSVPLNLEFLERLRKEAMVEVDNQNRIIKYVANDGSLTIPGDLSQSMKMEQRLLERKTNRNQGDDHINIDKSSKRIKHSETDPLEKYLTTSDDFDEPEVKLEPFRGSLIDDFEDPDEDIKAIPTLELREPKKVVEEESVKIEMMEFPIKNEEDLIFPKEEELEYEEDIKPELNLLIH